MGEAGGRSEAGLDCIVVESSAPFYCILQVAERQLGLERELKRELEQLQTRLQSAQQGTQVLQMLFCQLSSTLLCRPSPRCTAPP